MRVGGAGLGLGLAVVMACGGSGGGGGGGGTSATLQLSTDGVGEIEVTGGAAAHCRGSCAVTAAAGASVKLVAHPDQGEVFAGWGGACSGTGECSLSLSGTMSVSARFQAAQASPPTPPQPQPGSPAVRHALAVAKAGDGSGTVASAPPGIECGSTCTASFDEGTSVTLTATADPGTRFDGWGGACTGTAACAVKLDDDRQVTASFSTSPALKRYTATELTSPDGRLFGRRLDTAGNVVGSLSPNAPPASPLRACLRDPSGKVTLLPPESGGAGLDVNDAGQVAIAGLGDGKAYRWSGQRLEQLSMSVAPSAIGPTGAIVGATIPSGGAAIRAFVAERTDVRLLAPLNSGDFSLATAVNKDLVVVGSSGDRAVRWLADGSVAELPAKPSAAALGLNDAGVAVGFSDLHGNARNGFLVDLATGKLTDVPPAGSDVGVTLEAVSSSGVAVGEATRDGRLHAIVWQDGKYMGLEDLVEDPGFDLNAATDVNDRGQILVQGVDRNFHSVVHSAILTPAP
jgi:List-Bact-rpt repeat protein